ncbi:MAG TPA: lysine exporter LysO family protein [Bacteroidales bacterium]|nr:lysine exporter LysO family protein [Bacteroidales bacterium]
MKGSLLIVGFFVLGLLAGAFKLVPASMGDPDFATYAVYGLMILVGTGIGADKKARKVFSDLNPGILLPPVSTIVGTFLGVIVYSLLFKAHTITESLAVGAGFGYYSLSSILLTQTAGKTLGVIALISNILREILTLILAPVMVRYFGAFAPMASAGATSMDTTLPVIVKFAGKEYAAFSLFNGIVLTTLVPVIISVLYP